MSGKLFTVSIVAGCVLLAGFAALRQSQTTRRVRALWGAQGASVIQNADTVFWHRPSDVQAEKVPPLNISGAAGLVHLRATLVDDVYLVPETPFDQSSNQDDWNRAAIKCVHRLEFWEDSTVVLVEIETDSGMLHCDKTGVTATLIAPSRDAVRQYIEVLGNELGTTVNDLPGESSALTEVEE